MDEREGQTPTHLRCFVLFFVWDVMWVATFFLSDHEEPFAYFFDFAALALSAADVPFILLGDVTAMAIYLLAFMAGVANFLGATALLAYLNDPRIRIEDAMRAGVATAGICDSFRRDSYFETNVYFITDRAVRANMNSTKNIIRVASCRPWGGSPHNPTWYVAHGPG
tara:strand:- start:3214 stop:3714 length:501 start_codon:yes stop_codon:yes gene_type:complete